MATHDASNTVASPSPSKSLSTVDLLRAKLILSSERQAPRDVYEQMLERYPDARDQPWSKSMEEPIKHVVLNSLSFDLTEVDDAEVGCRISRRPPIEVGNSIMLYVNDVKQRRTDRRFKSLFGSSISETLAKIDPSMQSPFYYLVQIIIEKTIQEKSQVAHDAEVDATTS